MGFETRRSGYRIGWAIELCWVLASMAFAVILMSFYNAGLRPIFEDVVIPMHDAYFVMSGAEYALYHVVWMWAWVGLARGIFTRLVVRRVYYFFLISIGAHLLNLVYFMILVLIFHLASRGLAGEITRPMTLYLGTGIAFWVVVLLTGIVRRSAKSAFDPESKPEQ